MCARKKATQNFTKLSYKQGLIALLAGLVLVSAAFGYGAPTRQDLVGPEHNRRQQRVEAEKEKIAELNEGEMYTLVFLGIRSGAEKAESTLTAQCIPGFSGKFGIGTLEAENFSLLPNENGIWQAFGGVPDEAQVLMAIELATASLTRGLTLQVITHSNGIQGASEFFARMGEEFQVANTLVIAPNSREWSDLAVIVSHSITATLITSNKDNRLSRPRVAHRSMELWRGNLKYGYGFSNIAFLQTFQKAHGAQAYLSEYRAGRYRQFQ